VWSFFTGAMGLDLGFEQVGLPAQLAVEVEPIFCDTISVNRPGITVLQRDIATVSGQQLRRITGQGSSEIDLIIGGPPCQSFCPGGKRAALSDPRGNLILEYLRLVSELRPRFFVLENVANLVTAALRHRPIDQRPGRHWNLSIYSANQPQLFPGQDQSTTPHLDDDELSGSAIKFLFETAVADLGYTVSFGVLDSSEFGAPQKRHRFVMIGARDGKAPRLPTPTHGPGNEHACVTVKDAIADLALEPGQGSQYTDGVRQVFDLVPPGGNWRSLPQEIAKSAMGERSYAAGGGKTGFFRRLSWDEPSPTITGAANRKGSALCHPDASRPLSVRECARLQGFPDEWIFTGSMARQYKQIGNAVPVALGAAVGSVLRNALSHAGDPDDRSQNEMLIDAVTKVRSAARNKRGGPL